MFKLTMGDLLYVSFLVTSIFLSKNLGASYNGINHCPIGTGLFRLGYPQVQSQPPVNHSGDGLLTLLSTHHILSVHLLLMGTWLFPSLGWS